MESVKGTSDALRRFNLVTSPSVSDLDDLRWRVFSALVSTISGSLSLFAISRYDSDFDSDISEIRATLRVQ